MHSSPPWWATRGLDVVLTRWMASPAIRPCLDVDETIAARRARVVPLGDSLAEPLRQALRAQKIHTLYKHQAQAFAAARRGQHVAVATPTASGKSLCFHLPVVQGLLEDPQARALYLFPTKALARDQEVSLRALLTATGHALGVGVYDGDTPADARRSTRERSPVLLTNPDMLHANILPQHTQWAAMFRGLRYIVVDELHAYRGVFGSHLANVFARLRRVARFYGSDPTFLCASATIGNVAEHAGRLFGVDSSAIEVVQESGAPNGERRLLLYNPPVVNAELGIRASYLKSGVRLAADLIRARVPTLIFAPSRNAVEITLKYLRDACADDVPADAIMGYRGGYLPSERRSVEKGLRQGSLLGVVATLALELGVDVGDLDAVVCLGYPGSLASLWQRFGRAGRRQGTSLAVLVASSSPVDQYLARHPDFFLGGCPEEARIDPANLEILLPHLQCAAFELPFSSGETFGPLDAADTGQALDYLCQQGLLHASSGRYHWVAEAFPAHRTNLRSTGWENVVVVDQDSGRALAELDGRAAYTMLHERAIYQHNAEQYQVEKFDYENQKAFVRPVVADYFTTALTNSTVRVVDEPAATRALVSAAKDESIQLGWGDVLVIEKVIGFKKITFHTHENVGYGNVTLPDRELHTTGFWLTLSENLCRRLRLGRASTVDGLRGLALALQSVSALALLCELHDLRQTLGDGTKGDPPPRDGDESWRDAYRTFEPTVFLYDAYPGGVGFAPRLYARAEELLQRARALVVSCPCLRGCPACVGPSDDHTVANPKRVTRCLLDAIAPPT